MGAHPSSGRENTLRSDHSSKIFGRGFNTNQEDPFSAIGGFNRTFGVQVNLTRGGAGAGGKPGRDDLGGFDGTPVKDRCEDLIELVSGDASHGRLPVD